MKRYTMGSIEQKAVEVLKYKNRYFKDIKAIVISGSGLLHYF